MNRRRMMMENKKPVYIFREGSSTFENTAGKAELNRYAEITGGTIAIDGSMGQSVGTGSTFVYFGKFRVPVDFSKRKTLCIEAWASTKVSAAVGYAENFNIGVHGGGRPENYFTVERFGRKVYCFDISEINGNRYICGGIDVIHENAPEALKIYNIWLE